MAVKGLKIIICICMALFLAPFDIFADTLIVPIYSSSSEQSEWQSKLTVTNYCDGSNTQASCKLTFTLNDDYYGFVMFNAYNNNTQIYTNQYIYIAGGIGEYNYLFYQNGVIPITNIEITYVELFLRGANINLSEVVQLLTLINSSNQAIYSNSVTIRNNLISVLNEEIEANGYLEIISQLRNWNFPIESFPIISSFMKYNSTKLKEYYILNNYYTFPIFSLTSNDVIYNLSSGADKFKMVLFIVDSQAYNLQQIKDNIIEFGDLTVDNFKYWGNTRLWTNNKTGYFTSFDITISSFTTYTIKTKKAVDIIPIYFGSTLKEYVSTEFALQFGLSNSFLENIQIIANGTNASHSAAQSSDSANSQLQQDSSTLFQQEDSFKSNMQSAMQNVPQFNVNTFGTKFMSSAQWVRTQYERMTNNTPFQQLITFSLLVGLSMILIGKVRK